MLDFVVKKKFKCVEKDRIVQKKFINVVGGNEDFTDTNNF